MKGLLIALGLMAVCFVSYGMFCEPAVPENPQTIFPATDHGLFRTIQYDTEAERLTVTFKSGYVYEYRQIPMELYLAFAHSQENGTYFNRYIKGKFPFRRL